MNSMFKRGISILLSALLISFTCLVAQPARGRSLYPPPDSAWADSLLKTLTLEKQIAQLIMVRAYSNRDSAHVANIARLVKDYGIGGLCFFQGGPARQAALTNHYQQLAGISLFIAIDAEWGLGMRLDSTPSFPYQMTMGALRNDSLIHEMGVETGRQCKRMGIHINFAPVADINSNPNNPVINFRSFGEDRERVAAKAIAYMKGLQSQGILATAKHFPGHGDTDTDSHYSLPVIRHSRARMDSIELYPFKRMIAEGVDAVMTAHLFIPCYDSTPGVATTLSGPVVTGLLEQNLGFKGLKITDALDMKGVTAYHKPGEIELMALLAGNDILLLPQDAVAAIERICRAVDEGQVTAAYIEEKCRKVLTYKARAGLRHYRPVDLSGLLPDLNSFEADGIGRSIYQQAVTLVSNRDSILPLDDYATLKIAALALGSREVTPFQHMLMNYSRLTPFCLRASDSLLACCPDSLVAKYSCFDLVIAGIFDASIFPKNNYNISPGVIALLDSLARKTRVVLALFSNPYTLSLFPDPGIFQAVMVCYQDNPVTQETAAQAIMGGRGLEGELPVTASPRYPLHAGLRVEAAGRFKFGIPEDEGIRSADLRQVDSIALSGIIARAYPGCQIVVVKDGTVMYNKAFGFHTYEANHPVKPTDLYDIASVTKAAATTLSVMKLADEGKLDPDLTLPDYLPSLKHTNKKHITLRQMMAHQSRLKPWIPFYQYTLVNGQPDTNIYKPQPSKEFPLKVAEGMYISPAYEEVIYDSIARSHLLKKNEYKYSDLGFYLMKRIIGKAAGIPLDRYVDDSFYRPMGLTRITYNPWKSFSLDEVVPTERDTVFRHQLVHGTVHDQGAALMGGVSGHAGLFSNALDLAVVFQMLINGGEYAGKKYINPSTITEFTRVQFPEAGNRRGMGFDKPLLRPNGEGPTCASASPRSFGHTGFTGAYVWADPVYNLVYVFLSNRVYPDASSNKLASLNIRTRIQQVIYDAILKK
jgi:beta-glucosidase-like glycosyl hydrolase/CubicO group peptidase (beta-lactamase class C family)